MRLHHCLLLKGLRTTQACFIGSIQLTVNEDSPLAHVVMTCAFRTMKIWVKFLCVHPVQHSVTAARSFGISEFGAKYFMVCLKISLWIWGEQFNDSKQKWWAAFRTRVFRWGINFAISLVWFQERQKELCKVIAHASYLCKQRGMPPGLLQPIKPLDLLGYLAARGQLVAWVTFSKVPIWCKSFPACLHGEASAEIARVWIKAHELPMWTLLPCPRSACVQVRVH